jgi:hypothetical protein
MGYSFSRYCPPINSFLLPKRGRKTVFHMGSKDERGDSVTTGILLILGSQKRH